MKSKMIAALSFITALSFVVLLLGITTGHDGGVVYAHQQDPPTTSQTATTATMRKARALVEYLEKTKDKRVERVAVSGRWAVGSGQWAVGRKLTRSLSLPVL